jgi:hypothetical protein
MSTVVTTNPTAERTQRAYARLAGLMYLVVLAFDIVGVVIVSSAAGSGAFVEVSRRIVASETLYRFGLCCGLVGSLSTILLAIGLYVAVKPAGENLALLALLFRVAEAAIGGTAAMLAFTALQINLAANHAGAFTVNQLGALADVYSRGRWTRGWRHLLQFRLDHFLLRVSAVTLHPQDSVCVGHLCFPGVPTGVVREPDPATSRGDGHRLWFSADPRRRAVHRLLALDSRGQRTTPTVKRFIPTLPV